MPMLKCLCFLGAVVLLGAGVSVPPAVGESRPDGLPAAAGEEGHHAYARRSPLAGARSAQTAATATSGVWRRLPGAARDVGVGADGTAWMVSRSPAEVGGFGVYRWNGGSDWTSVA